VLLGISGAIHLVLCHHVGSSRSTPIQVVASEISKINTALSTFEKLENKLGNHKDKCQAL